MKLNFRKIASVLSSAVMVSSTVALAAAASYPAPFVNSGNADVAVVWGSTATLDNAAVTDLVASLNTKVTPGSTTTTVTGESFTLQDGDDYLNLDETLATAFDTLGIDEMPSLLADGEYEVDDTEYEQTLSLYPLALGHQQDNDFNDEKPYIGFDLVNGNGILNYTLEFDSSVQFESDTEITILGKKYYIAENKSDMGEAQMAVTLMDATASQRINEGETLTVEATNGKTYTVKLDFVEDGDADEDEANFVINDEAIDGMEPGDSEEVEEGVYIVVDKTQYIDSDRRTSYAQFSLGTGKIVLKHGEEVELNDESLSSNDMYEDHLLTAYFTNSSSTAVDTLKLNWKAGDDMWLAQDSDLVLPGFGAVKLVMGEFTQPDAETTVLKNSGDTYSLETMIEDGEVSIPLVYRESSNAYLSGIGEDAGAILVTRGLNATGNYTSTATVSGDLNLSLDSTVDPTFVASWSGGAFASTGTDEADSFAFKLKKIDYISSSSKTEVTLENLAEGQDDVLFDDIDDTVNLGSIELKLVSATEGGNANIMVNPRKAGVVYVDRVFTKEGLTIMLPNVTNYYHNKTIFYEEDVDGNIGKGGAFNITTVVDSSDGVYAGSIVGPTSPDMEEDSDTKVAYVESAVATKILLTNPDSGVSTIEIMYPGDESYAEVMVAESGATMSGGATGNIVPIFDTEAASVTGKNLIVVGGSCVNTMAASLLGLPANSCGSAWQTKTNVGAGQFLIQTFARDGGKVATLVAGYNMEDTANAVKALKTDTTVEIAAGKKFVGTATSVQAVNVA